MDRKTLYKHLKKYQHCSFMYKDLFRNAIFVRLKDVMNEWDDEIFNEILEEVENVLYNQKH